MSLCKIREAWDKFFFSPQSPLPIALFRIFYGICVSATLILLHSDWLEWFGVHGWVTLSTMRAVEPGVRLNLFTLMPQDDRWIAAFFWISLGFAVLLTIGLWTRVSSVAVFSASLPYSREISLSTIAGTLFCASPASLLMFAPGGAALSLDRLIRVRKRLEGPALTPRAPSAQRMIQFELALLYLVSFAWKMKGAAWRNGTALYYVTHFYAAERFPLPGWFQYPVIQDWHLVHYGPAGLPGNPHLVPAIPLSATAAGAAASFVY